MPERPSRATHPCPGPHGSRTPPAVRWDRLSCPWHWRQVPAALQAAVYDTWDNGLGYGTPEHIRACADAVEAMHE